MKRKDNRPKRLLLVDDDRSLLESMGSWLGSIGYDVTLADSVAAAKRTCEQRNIDLAMVDLRLGDGDGFDVLSHFKKHYPQIPVVLVSGYATADTGVEAMRAGAFDLLTKPLIDQ